MADLERLSKFDLPSLDSLVKLYADIDRHRSPQMQGKICLGKGSAAFKRAQRFLEAIGLGRDLMRVETDHQITLSGEVAIAVESCLAKLLDVTEQLTDIKKSQGRQRELVLGTTPLLGTRPLPPWLREFHSQFQQIKERKSLSEEIPIPRVSMIYGEPHELADEMLQRPAIDIVLTYCSAKKRFNEDDVIERVPLHRCLLVRGGHDFPVKFDASNSNEWSNLLQQLEGLRIAMVPDSRTVPAYPINKVSRVAEVVEVGSTLEAHANVRARSVDAAFSFRELLSEGENKYLSVIDISRLRQIEGCDLVLLRGRGYSRDSESDRGIITDMIASHLAEQMLAMKKRFSDLQSVTKSLQRFRFAYHTGEDHRGGRKAPAKWFRGGLNLEATMPFVSKPDRCVWLVKGKHVVEPAGEKSRGFDIFGRVVGPNSSGALHLLWRETQLDDEHGAGSCIFSQSDLDSGQSICGVWIGRTSWCDRDLSIASTGLFIFDTKGDRTSAELNRIVSRAHRSGAIHSLFVGIAEGCQLG
jgi:hypothetical protein